MQIDEQLQAAAACAILYEHFITLDDEIRLMWRAKWSTIKVLFVLNRISVLSLAVICTMGLSDVPSLSTYISAEVLEYLGVSLNIMISIVCGVFAAIRVYAVGRNKWSLASLVLLLQLVEPAANLQSATLAGNNLADKTQNIIELVVRGSHIVANAIVLAVTWKETCAYRAQALQKNVKAPLPALLLRDGVIYFACMITLNITQIVAFEVTNTVLDPGTMVTVMTSILTSRFMLDLREWDTSRSDDQQLSALATSRSLNVRFTSILGSMGAQMQLEVGLDCGGLDKDVERGVDQTRSLGHPLLIVEERR